jgi:hypothetical protein
MLDPTRQCVGLAIVASSLTCNEGVPSIEELFKWLMYASEGTCLQTRPQSGEVDEGYLRNPREWPAALAASLEARIMAACPVHVACWDVASAALLLQPVNAAVPWPCEPPKRTRRKRRSKQVGAAGTGIFPKISEKTTVLMQAFNLICCFQHHG